MLGHYLFEDYYIHRGHKHHSLAEITKGRYKTERRGWGEY